MVKIRTKCSVSVSGKKVSHSIYLQRGQTVQFWPFSSILSSSADRYHVEDLSRLALDELSSLELTGKVLQLNLSVVENFLLCMMCVKLRTLRSKNGNPETIKPRRRFFNQSYTVLCTAIISTLHKGFVLNDIYGISRVNLTS